MQVDRSCPEVFLSTTEPDSSLAEEVQHEERRRGTGTAAFLYPSHPWRLRQITRLQNHLYPFRKTTRLARRAREASIV
jgi:hypothetical protein